MTRDLEETLNELGPGYREVVDRLTDAYEPLAAGGLCSGIPVPRREWRARVVRRSAGYLLAASLLVFVGFGVYFRAHPRSVAAGEPSRVYTVRASTAENEYRLAIIRDDAAVQEMIRTQRPDGSWGNDFLTRQNCEALRHHPSPEAQIAFKKALRHLRRTSVVQ
jgi:hypothetical protein